VLLVALVGSLGAGLIGARPAGRTRDPAAVTAEVVEPCKVPTGRPLVVPRPVAVNPRGVPPPPVSARAVAVVDGASGDLLYGRNEHLRLPPASTTKIATAMVVLRYADLDAPVVVDVDARRMTDSSVMGLLPGMRLTVRDLLYGLMLPSGNDAAIALARHVAGSVSSFVQMMNQEVARLGLSDSHFTNPHGLDSFGLYSSAYDLAMMARAAMADPRFAEIVRTPVWHVRSLDIDLYNGNGLLRSYPGADGVKIGWTEDAGETAVMSAIRNGHRVFVAVLGSKDRATDSAALLDWAFAHFTWIEFNPGVARALSLAERLLPGQRGLLAVIGVCPGAKEGTFPAPSWPWQLGEVLGPPADSRE